MCSTIFLNPYPIYFFFVKKQKERPQEFPVFRAGKAYNPPSITAKEFPGPHTAGEEAP
jgi:hypothetical protein